MGHYKPRDNPYIFMTPALERMNSESSPDEPFDSIRQRYREYLASLGVLDVTPISDVIGWIARRMTAEHTLDAIIVVYGDRGVGKSMVCGYLGERLDMRLCKIDGKPLKSHFSIDNVRSVDKSGTLAMLNPHKLKESPNQVFVLDDASIAANARKFQTPENQYLNYILTTARIYRHCIIINTIASNLIDSVARSFADVGILVDGVIPGTTINRCRVYRMSQSNHMGFGTRKRESGGKYFQLKLEGRRNRMRTWYTTLPSKEWVAAYNVLRKENTDNIGNIMEEWADSENLPKTVTGKIDTEFTRDYSAVIDLYTSKDGRGKSPTILGISRKTGLTRERVNKMIGEYNKRLTEGVDPGNV